MRFNLSGSSVALSRLPLVLALLLAAVSMLFVPGNETHAQAAVPAAPTGLAAPTVAHDSVTLRWDDPGVGSITGYQVLRRSRDGDEYGDGEGATGFVVIVDDTGSQATTYTDTSVTARTRYVYRLKAINSVGLSEKSSYLNIETSAAPPPPSAPAGLTTSSVAHDSVTLSWDDPGDSSITGYQVLRRSRDESEYGDGEGATGFVVIVDDTGSQATIYTDTSVIARTRYVYRVKAINSVGLSPRSSYLNIETSTAPPSLSTPAEPTGLTASSVAHDSVTLSWNEPEDSTIESYQVLRRSRDGDEYGNGLGDIEFVVIVDDTGSPDTTYTDTSVTQRTRYAYGVKARNPQGLSDVSSPANGETLEAPSDTPQSLVRGSRPNVVLILADDLGWGDILSNNPDSAMTTPRIDGIAAAGANFTDAHSPSSMCSPTRYGLLTGRYAWRTWLSAGVLGGSSRPMIGPDRPTLGTLLQGQGYRTAAIGKWHLGMDFAHLSDIDAVNEVNRGIDFDADILNSPVDHGFDEFFGTSANLNWQPHIYIRDRRFLANPDRESQPDSAFYGVYEVLDRLTDEAVSFIEREGQANTPFFLYLPLHTPHVPLAPNRQFYGKTGLGRYADVVAQMDWTIGQVLDALTRTGIRDDTLVIFSSDNGSYKEGNPIPNHIDEVHLSNGHWAGGKGHIHEGGHRVPLLMQWPRGIEQGSTITATVSLTDIYATLADILGEDPEPGVATDSISLLPLLHSEVEARGVPVVHHSGNGMFALRDGQWKLVFGNGNGKWHGSNTGVPFGKPWRLFDLEQDHREQNNVAADYPEVMAQMEAAFEQIRAAEDGTLSGSATLKSLDLAGVDMGKFDPDVRTYSATVNPDVEIVQVKAVPTATDANVRIQDAYGASEHGRHGVRLAEGITTITIYVTAPDESVTAIYKVTVEPWFAITGTSQVGQTLIADTSGVTDADGLGNATFNYQWVRKDGSADTDIVGATEATYILTSNDVGKTIKVRVSFTDDRGNAETRTSKATDTVGEALSELTAAQENDTFPPMSGYSIFGNRGTLSPDGWEIDGTHYTVKYLVHAGESLVLGIDKQLPTDFTLHVGDSSYLGSESKIPPSVEGVEGYWWDSATPDWFADEPVQVRLAIHMDVPLGERPRAPVTGNFRYIPSVHDGSEDFSFRIYFSEGVATTVEAIQDHVLTIAGGTVSSVKAVGSESRIWAISVTPDSRDTVTIKIEADLDCHLVGAVCAADSRRLFNRMELKVPMMSNSSPTGSPIISGTVEVGETLTADTSGISDADGLTGATFSYQWVSYDGNGYTDIQGATDSTYTLVPADEGKAFKVRVSFTDDAGYKESLTSALFGSERPYGLNASESDGAVALTWKLPAGWPYSSTFQILRNRPELGEAEPLVHVRYTESGANTYTDTDVEPGVLYVYRVKGVDPFGYTHEASEPVEIRTTESTPVENRPATGDPTIGGTVQVGETLSADTSGIADAEGLDNAVFSYQWLADDAEMQDATDSTYVLDPDDEGKTIKVRVIFTDDAGNEETLTSAPTAEVTRSSNHPATGLPVIRGQVRVGATLRASLSILDDPDGLSGATFTYQWLADDAENQDATDSTYVLDTNDEGKTIKVRVIFTDDAGNEETLTSAPTAQVVPTSNNPATGLPVIRGQVRVGATLRASLSILDDPDGLSGATFTYQWLADDAENRDATDSTYVLDAYDEGKTIRVRLSFTDDAGNEETLTSVATSAVERR